MSQYQAIKAATNAYIKTNGRQEITGAILNAVMIATIDSLGKFYQFVGNAVPDTDPGNFDQNIAYLASTPGTYTHLGGFTLTQGEVSVIKFDGQWKKEVVIIVPSKVSQFENDLGFITNAVSDLLNYYSKEETDSALGNYFTKAQVQYILGEYYDKEEVDTIIASFTRQSYVESWDGSSEPVVADIPEGIEVIYNGVTYTGTLAPSEDTIGNIYLVKGGAGYDMYVTSKDSVYSWVNIGTSSIDLSDYVTKEDFQETKDKTDIMFPLVLDEQEIDPSEQTLLNYQINTSNKYTHNTSYKHIIVPVTPGSTIFVTAATNKVAQMAWLTDDDAPVADGTPHFVPGTERFDLPAGESGHYVVPEGGYFMYFYAGASPYEFLPQSIVAAESKIPSFVVVDSLSSHSKTDPLSADKGRILAEGLDGLESAMDTPVDISLLPNVMYGYIASGGNYVSQNTRFGKFLPVVEGRRYRITANASQDAAYSFLTSNSVTMGGTPAYVTGTSRMTITSGQSVVATIPEGCLYLQFNTDYDGTDHTPQSIIYIGGAVDQLEKKDVVLQAEISSVSEKVASGRIGEVTPDITLTSGHGINCKDGTAPSSDLLSNTGYIPLDNVSAIELSVNISTSSNTTRGIAFYDSEKVFLRGIPYPYDTTMMQRSYTIRRYSVPENAAYFRTCFYTEFESEFQCTLFRADASDNLATLLSDYLSASGKDLLTIGSPEIYHHPAIAAGANATTTEQVYALYDALASQYPQWFARESDIGTSSDGIHEIRHYRLRYNYNAVWSLGDYNNNRWEEFYSWRKILINSGTHGDEATAIWGVYFFIKALLEGDGEKWAEYIRSNIQIDIIPVLNPYGLNHNVRRNANNVDINRQFNRTDCVEAEALKGVARDLQPFAFIDCHTVGTTHGNYLGYLGGPGNGPIFGTLSRLINNLAALFREDWSDLASSAGIGNKPYLYCCIGESTSTPERAVAWMTFNITKSAVVCEALNVGSTSLKGKPLAKVTVDVLANLIPAFMKFN